MTPEAKERIEQIRRGEVPEGYKKTKAGIMPLDWCTGKEYKARDVFKSITNKKHNGEFEVLSATQDKGVIPRSQVDIDIKFDESSVTGYKKVDRGDFVISLRSFQGGIEYSEYEGLVSPAYTVLKPIMPICNGYYKAYLKTADYISRLNKGTYGIRDGKQIGFEDFGDMTLHYPSLAEQEKIAEVLSVQDRGIELKEKLLVEKQRQKKYLMQHLLTGKKRLPGFAGEWLFVRANQIFKNVTDKKHDGTLEVLSATQDKGIVPRSQVDIDIKYAEESLTGYKKVMKGNFVISLRSFQGGIEYSEYTGIVSPAYTVLTSIYPIEDNYYKQFFKSTDYINRLNVAVYGIRDGKQIGYEDFGRIKIPYPPIDEQKAIATVFEKADQEIDLLLRSLDQEKLKKKALMQLLLTGIVRV